MNSTYNKGFFTAFTVKGSGGLLRELKVPIKVRIPEIFKDSLHDFHEIQAIWDTGATNSVVSERLASKIKLIPTGMAKCRGVHEEKEVNTYIVDILINNTVLLEKHRVISGDLGDRDFDFLVGMDIITTGDCSITQEQDDAGRLCTVFSFRWPSAMQPIDYVAEINKFKAEQERHQKNQAKIAKFKKKQKKKK